MATLEELAQQFEDALSTSTGTTIAPGTVSPVGTTVGGKKQLSWPEVVKKIQENSAFSSSEYLPTQLAGVNTNDIYKAGAKSGMLPAGLATFTKSPFSSFASRTAANPYTPKSSSAAEAAAVSAQTQLTPVRGNVQRPEEYWTDTDMKQDALSAYSPLTLPGNMTFMPSISGMLGQMGSAIMDNLSGKTEAYNDLTMATSEQVEHLYNNNEFGNISTEEGRAKADSVVESWRNGQMIWNGSYTTSNVDMVTGKGYTDDEMSEFTIGTTNIAGTYGEQPEGPIDKFVNKYVSGPIRKFLGDDLYMGDEERYGGKTGYQKDGTFIDKFGNVSAGGWDEDWKDLVRTDPEKAGRLAKIKGIGYIGGLSKENYDLAIREAAAARTQRLANEMKADTNAQAAYAQQMAEQDQADADLGPVSTPGYDYWSGDPGDSGQDAVDSSAGGGEGMAGAGDEGSFYNSGGRVAMQEGGPAPQMPMPQQPQAQAQPQGVQGDIENLGMINEQAAAPQKGGQQSVKDDIPREADAGDYILPYETVLLTGLNQLNRYAREAVKLAIENDINLKGTDIDPTDDVPIKVSNYEYHIPKMLVPFFGGGKKYLDKIREEGLALRKRLEEEKQPPMQEQQPMEQKAAPAPQPQMVADAQPQAPQMPTMQEGGFVEDPTKAIKSAEQALTSDSSQPTQSAYNQVQALERSRIQKQQPPMVDPTGRVVQQGFAAPQGYDKGGTVSDEELAADRNILNELDPADLFALVMKSEIRDDENSEEQAKHFGSMVMNRVRNGSFGGKDLKQVLLKENQFAGINFKKDKNHRENFKRAIRGTKVDDPYFLKYKAIANQLINRKLPDPTNGALFVLNKKGYAKEQGLPEGSLPEYLTDVMETTQIGDLSYFNKGPLPTKKPPPPNLPAIEKAYNKGGFIEAAA